MRKIREILRLRYAEKLNQRVTALSVGVSPTTVYKCEIRAKEAGLSWPLPEEMDDAQLEALLYPPPVASTEIRAPLDCEHLYRELRQRKGVTLMLLWQEYKAANGEAAYQYSQFCEHYRHYCETLEVVMRKHYRAGEKGMVDFSGDGFVVLDSETGKEQKAELFVAVLGASNYTYAEAFPSQELRYWIEGHIHAYEYFGGVPEITIPDNTKTAVVRPSFYDPELNPTYREMARHYRTAIIPARPRKPRDKAKVEGAVLITQRQIVAALRNHQFFSFAQLNETILEKLDELNRRPFQKLEGSRRTLWEQLDRPALRALPAVRYTFAQWSRPKVNVDHHVEVEHHYYSVPSELIGRRIEARFTATTVEMFFRGKRVTAHQRSYIRGGYSTESEHRPAKHRAYAEWTPQRLIDWTRNDIGPMTSVLAEKIIGSRPHPEQGYRACLGLIRLCQIYGHDRLEAAAERALSVGAYSYRSIEAMLKRGLDRQPFLSGARQRRALAAPEMESGPGMADHENVRGRDYYN